MYYENPNMFRLTRLSRLLNMNVVDSLKAICPDFHDRERGTRLTNSFTTSCDLARSII